MKLRIAQIIRVYLAIVIAFIALAVQQLIALILSLGELFSMGIAKHSVRLNDGRVVVDGHRTMSLFDLPIGAKGLMWGSMSGIIMVLLIAIANNRKQPNILAFRKFRIKAAIPWTIAYIIFGIFSNWLVEHYEEFRSKEMEMMIRSSLTNPIMACLSIGFLVPIFEELLFRSWLFGKIVKEYGGGIAVIGTSILFIAIHVQYNLFILVVLSALSLILGMIRLRTDSILPSIVIHVVNNLIVLLSAMNTAP